MIISKVIFAAFLSLCLGDAHGFSLASKVEVTEPNGTSKLVTGYINGSDWYEGSVTEIPIENVTAICEDLKAETSLPGPEGIFSILVQDSEKSTLCDHILGLEPNATSVYRLKFDLKNVRYNVKVMYMYADKERNTVIPWDRPFELIVFSGIFYLTWTRTSSDPVELSFEYELLERIVDETKVYNESARNVTLQDLGGFRPNILRTFYIIGDSTKSNHSLDIVLEKLVLDERAGDMFSIGKASGKDSSFQSTPAIMFTSSITKPVRFIVSAKDVFVSMSTIYSQGHALDGQKVDFKLSYNVTGFNVIKPSPTPIVTTARSLAELQAVTMCFFELTDSEWTCRKFLDEHLKRFQDHVAELAQNFAEEEKIELPTSGGIRPEQVKVECFFQKLGKYNYSREDNYITVVITHPLDEEKPLFTNRQLTDFFKANYMGRDLSRLIGYTVKTCQTYPDYWSWYFGSIGIFCGCVLLLMIMWYWSHQMLKKENNKNKIMKMPTDYSNQRERSGDLKEMEDEPEPYMDENNESGFTAYDPTTVTDRPALDPRPPPPHPRFESYNSNASDPRPPTHQRLESFNSNASDGDSVSTRPLPSTPSTEGDELYTEINFTSSKL